MKGSCVEVFAENNREYIEKNAKYEKITDELKEKNKELTAELAHLQVRTCPLHHIPFRRPKRNTYTSTKTSAKKSNETKLKKDSSVVTFRSWRTRWLP
jgi:hypothetical protein